MKGSFSVDAKPGHRKNILSDSCSEIGVAATKGWLKGEEVWVAVQIFGEQSPPVTAEVAKPRSVTYASADSASRPEKSASHLNRRCWMPSRKQKQNYLISPNRPSPSIRKLLPKNLADFRYPCAPAQAKVATYNELVNDINGRSRRFSF